MQILQKAQIACLKVGWKATELGCHHVNFLWPWITTWKEGHTVKPWHLLAKKWRFLQFISLTSFEVCNVMYLRTYTDFFWSENWAWKYRNFICLMCFRLTKKQFSPKTLLELWLFLEDNQNYCLWKVFWWKKYKDTQGISI